ncbi:MAG: CocE/NonD family hydrolase, partial [Firmicutes bacterium]|nr:CocE/NonD family hydrolase [Bacillota bacterium]
PFWQDWSTPTPDSAYWRQRNWLDRVAAHPLPALHIGGWFDPYLRGTLAAYQRLQSAAVPQKLVIGPWRHIPWGGKIQNRVFAFRDFSIDREQVAWFRYWLAEENATEAALFPAVRVFEQGSQRWREYSRWPSEQTRHTWNLCSQGLANGDAGDGILQETACGKDQLEDVYVYDSRLPMICENYDPVDRSALQTRAEILVYTSLPLISPLSIWGTPHVSATFAADRFPTDVVAILSVVSADHTAQMVSIGRAELHAAEQTVSIVLRPTSIAVRAGECLRLEITGSAFPLLRRHPNGCSEEVIGRQDFAAFRITTVRLFHDAAHPAQLHLPVLPD